MWSPRSTIAIAVVLLLACLESSVATTLVVRNELSSGKTVYIHCRGDPQSVLIKTIAPGEESPVDVPPDGIIGGWEPAICVGQHSDITAILYLSSAEEKKRCKDKCAIKAADKGFYRWNKEKMDWEAIPTAF